MYRGLLRNLSFFAQNMALKSSKLFEENAVYSHFCRDFSRKEGWQWEKMKKKFGEVKIKSQIRPWKQLKTASEHCKNGCLKFNFKNFYLKTFTFYSLLLGINPYFPMKMPFRTSILRPRRKQNWKYSHHSLRCIRQSSITETTDGFNHA